MSDDVVISQREEWGIADVPPYPGEIWHVDERLARVAASKGMRVYRRIVTVSASPWRRTDTE